MWVYIVIATIVLLVYLINLNLRLEHLGVMKQKAGEIGQKAKEIMIEPQLNQPITWTEYNRNDIPTMVREKLENIMVNRILVETGQKISPVEINYVRIQQDNEKALWYVEVFVQNISGTIASVITKIVWQFWILPGNQYRLKDLRPYSFEDEQNRMVPKYFGVDKNLVITQDNITDPLKVNLEAGINSKDPTSLELYPIDKTLNEDIVGREGRQPYARCYNKWIIPDTVWDKNAYVSFTPDIIQNMLYRTGTYDDLFSRTRFDPSFPHGRATGGI